MMEYLSTLFYRLLMHSSICILEEFNFFLFIYLFYCKFLFVYYCRLVCFLCMCHKKKVVYLCRIAYYIPRNMLTFTLLFRRCTCSPGVADKVMRQIITDYSHIWSCGRGLVYTLFNWRILVVLATS